MFIYATVHITTASHAKHEKCILCLWLVIRATQTQDRFHVVFHISVLGLLLCGPPCVNIKNVENMADNCAPKCKYLNTERM